MIRLVLADVDGCLTAGEGRPIDLEVLTSVAAVNARSLVDPTTPAVSLCTGRPAPYVEVLAQSIAAYRPSIFENGCGLLTLAPYAFRAHPAIDEAALDGFRTAMGVLDRELVRAGRAMWQPGKAYSATLYPLAGDVHSLWTTVRDRLGGDVYVDEGTECINLMPAGIDKGAGVEWLARETGLDSAEIAGVGDADADLVFLRRVGVAAAPANATPLVRDEAAYVSPRPNGHGLLDVIDWVAAANRRVSAA